MGPTLTANEVSLPLLEKANEQFPIGPEHSTRPRRSLWKAAIIVSLVLSSSALYLFIPTRTTRYHSGSELDTGLPQCPPSAALAVSAPRKNIWKNIDLDEATSIRRWLHDPERGLNLTRSAVAYDSDNIIHLVEASKPRKADALFYLEIKNTPVPDKYAHAIINNGADETIVDYLIGPLPISGNTTLRPLSENYHTHPIPLNARSIFNWTLLGEIAVKEIGAYDEILQDLFGGSLKKGTILPAGVAPMSYDGTSRRTWLQLRRQLPGSWLRPLDFYTYIDMSGTDPSLSKVLKVVHGGKVYTTQESFFDAWRNGTLVKPVQDDPGNWASRERRGARLDLDDRAGPKQIQLDGARYRLDRKEDYLTWMGWSLYWSFERDMGLHLWNIKFRGDSVIYELSPQEALAQYSGSDPHQASTVWLDRAFGMGGNVKELILGYDCPEYATLLDTTLHESGTTVMGNAICIFERDSGKPLSRHWGQGKGETGAVKGYELVIRSISTVGNYDYIFDYTLQLDGSIEIRVSASGYLQGGSWNPTQDPYGHRLQRTSMGSLHDHVINFKVDFDVAGTKNSLMELKLEVEEVEAKWDEDWGLTQYQQRMVRKEVQQESLFDYPKNGEGTFVVVNPNELNAWDNPRGYMIHPGPTVHLTNTNPLNKRMEHNANWAKHHLGVSKRKDTEGTSSSMWNMNLPGKPAVDFYKFFDEESIVEEDLVVWLNLGTHHIPRAEDAPNTLTNIATSYVMLSPWNFNDYDVSIESRNSVLLNHKAKREWERRDDISVEDKKKKKAEWVVDEAVAQPQCVPEYAGELVYGRKQAWDEFGKENDNVLEVFGAVLTCSDEGNHGMRAWAATAHDL